MRPFALALLLLLPLAEPPAPDASLRDAAAAIAGLHRRADALAPTDPKAAAADLAEGLKLALPPGEAARTLRGDLFARIGELKLKAGDATGALQAARAGLGEEAGKPTNALTALLRLREGEALEALGRDDEALDSYSQVIAVAKKVLEQRRAPGRKP